MRRVLLSAVWMKPMDHPDARLLLMKGVRFGASTKTRSRHPALTQLPEQLDKRIERSEMLFHLSQSVPLAHTIITLLPEFRNTEWTIMRVRLQEEGEKIEIAGAHSTSQNRILFQRYCPRERDDGSEISIINTWWARIPDFRTMDCRSSSLLLIRCGKI